MTKVASFTIVAFLLLSYALFLTSGRWEDKGSFVHLVLTLQLFYNPLIVLTFLSFGFGVGAVAIIYPFLFGQLISSITGFGPYRFPPISFLITGLISCLLLKKDRDSARKNNLDREELESQYNILNKEGVKNESEKEGWQRRMLKYSMLREITERLSSSLNLEEISHLVTDSALYIIGKGEMASLFLREEGKPALKVTSLPVSSGAPKPCHRGDSFEPQAMRVKSSAGDVFDEWVLRRRQNLLVAHGEKDFRFRAPAEGQGKRKVKSLISSPLLWEGEVRGILRLDSSSADEYAADDLRLLDIIAGLASLAMENAELYQKTEELAIRDNLTGLYVHKYFQDRLEEELKRALAEDYPLSLVLLDLDHFKDYNDRFGHIAGDIVLRHLAHILMEEAGPGNLTARYGGEEFCLLLPRTDKEGACRLAERIRGKVAGHVIALRRTKTRITVSLGVAAFPRDARTGTALIKKADEALYRAKEKGRDQVCI